MFIEISVKFFVAFRVISITYAGCTCCGASSNIEIRNFSLVLDRLVQYLEPVCRTVTNGTVVPGFGEGQTKFERQPLAQCQTKVVRSVIRHICIGIPTKSDLPKTQRIRAQSVRAFGTSTSNWFLLIFARQQFPFFGRSKCRLFLFGWMN